MNRLTTTPRLRSALASLMLVLAGCGGGGGDEVAPPSAGAKPLALTPQTMADAAALAVGNGEALLQIGQLAVDFTNRFGSTLTLSESCPNGGTLTLTLLDRDGDGKPSAGDRVTGQMHDCGLPLLRQVLGGSVGFEIQAAAPAPNASLRGTVDLGDGVEIADFNGQVAGVSVTLQGTLAVDWSRGPLRTALAVSSTAADDLRIVGIGPGSTVTDSFHTITASKLLAYGEARAIVSLAFRYDSEVLGGSVTVSTPQALRAYLNTYPEEGRVEVRGAGATVLALTPNFVSASDQFDLALDVGGDGSVERTGTMGWAGSTLGYLWWDGVQALSWSYNSYATQPFASTAFSVGVTMPAVPSADAPVRVQFSRVPADLVATPQFRFRDGGSTQGYDPVQTNVSATTMQDGALLLVRPDRPLRHARWYQFEMSTDGGTTWGGGPLTVHDALGNTATLGAFNSITTPDTMRAVAEASSRVLADAPSSVQLSAAGSVSTRPIAAWHWAQISGSPLAFGTPDAATTSVRLVTAPSAALEQAVVELTITDTAGEVETTRLTLALLRTTVTGRVLYYRSTPGDYIGQGQIALVSDANGTFSSAVPNSGYVSYNYNAPDYSAWWSVVLATADAAPLRVGAYENAARAPFHGTQNGVEMSGSGRGCNTLVGRFDVLEIQTDGAGTITRLAVDFEQHCEGAQAPPLFGSLRIDSSLPLRP